MLRVWGLGFRVQGFGFGVQGLGVSGLGFRDLGIFDRSLLSYLCFTFAGCCKGQPIKIA